MRINTRLEAKKYVFSLGAAVVAVGCAAVSGLDQLEVVRDGGRQDDGGSAADSTSKDSPVSDSPADSTVRESATCPSPACTGAARTCSNDCNTQYDQCKTQFCDGGFCSMCSAARDMCKSGCVTTCKTCQNDATCVDMGACSQGVDH